MRETHQSTVTKNTLASLVRGQMGEGRLGLVEALGACERHRRNPNEEFWHTFFSDNPFLLLPPGVHEAIHAFKASVTSAASTLTTLGGTKDLEECRRISSISAMCRATRRPVQLSMAPPSTSIIEVLRSTQEASSQSSSRAVRTALVERFVRSSSATTAGRCS